eukprot:3663798-Alexandrium_andersonii.AAC.1
MGEVRGQPMPNGSERWHHVFTNLQPDTWGATPWNPLALVLQGPSPVHRTEVGIIIIPPTPPCAGSARVCKVV